MGAGIPIPKWHDEALEERILQLAEKIETARDPS